MAITTSTRSVLDVAGAGSRAAARDTGALAGGRVVSGAARRKRRLPSAWHLFLIPVSVLFLLPFVQMFLASVSPEKELVSFPPPFIPSRIDFGGYEGLFTQSNILLWLLNTVIVSTVGIASHLVLCSLAGYGFARLKFRGRQVGMFAILATIMIPTQLLMIPTYILFSQLGLVNGLGAAIVPWLSSAFGIFLMRQFFLSLPAELEESGMLDGANRWQVFTRIILPLAKPALTTLAIFTLLGSWNDLVWPLIAINNDQAFTLQLGLANFQGTRRTQWALLMAGNVVATLPLIVFFLFAQKQFVQTMTLSGLKG
ncbi:carbohydrate ABC transporter permease [Schumannella luteola]|uniref:Multiple sugar transport system permease protein n=1 Tax=Schumannella luteola TaxID=472059 RepID=A0A852YKH9_9MICO|nr:carbohydrate ABC transporter permease [Schumannella luteola]NYH00518.1 multiple sugar transport system permease protein [Schumannella luteola]TPX06226.1 carbohydrate ABC transporter permease [Schumannella luteola]